jgi:hypothetical protein
MESQENPRKRSAIRDLWNNFAGYSTLHGLHFLVDGSSCLRRLIWFVLLCVATSLFVYIAFKGLKKWQKHEVFITTELKPNNVSIADYKNINVWNKCMNLR